MGLRWVRGGMRNLILIVEDEPLVRMLAVDVAQDAGFDTLEAASADEALLLLEAHPNIQILMTDIDMPGSMNGLRLAAITRERWPAIEIVVVSGMRRPQGDELPAGCAFYGQASRFRRDNRGAAADDRASVGGQRLMCGRHHPAARRSSGALVPRTRAHTFVPAGHRTCLRRHSNLAPCRGCLRFISFSAIRRNRLDADESAPM